jgi:hypothetical protein
VRASIWMRPISFSAISAHLGKARRNGAVHGDFNHVERFRRTGFVRKVARDGEGARSDRGRGLIVALRSSALRCPITALVP